MKKRQSSSYRGAGSSSTDPTGPTTDPDSDRDTKAQAADNLLYFSQNPVDYMAPVARAAPAAIKDVSDRLITFVTQTPAAAGDTVAVKTTKDNRFIFVTVDHVTGTNVVGRAAALNGGKSVTFPFNRISHKPAVAHMRPRSS